MTVISFNKEFKFGASTASYQIEGAYDEDGRECSIWDTFSRTPGKVLNGDNGDVACDSYHRMDEDIELLKNLNVQTYRFSIAWPRIISCESGQINKRGIEHYHEFIDKLLENNVEPIVTMYHWDLPQKLQDNGGWKNRETIDAFEQYAEVLFKEYGSKVKKWLTINEPWCVAFLGNYSGEQAPGEQNLQSAITVSHHLLLAHGKAVQVFRRSRQDGKIGFAPNVSWYEPYSNKQEDIDACQRSHGWFMDWFFDPVFKGEYPKYLVDWFAEKGADLVIEEGDMSVISEPIDILGINYYTGTHAKHKENTGLFDTEQIDLDYDKTDIGFKIFPEGFYKVLLQIKNKYGDIPIIITENGSCYNDELTNGRVKDDKRIKYYRQHLTELNRAIESGVNIISYNTWSLMDNFEWGYGYSKRFGLVHVNFNTLERIKKDSFYWYSKLAKNHWFEL